jgi:AcrR family transcriptional regulator
MGRPPLHDTQDLLDAAVGIAASRGPAHVTMTALAQATGAPSGSLYHRFTNRSALLGAVWLRTIARFQAGFVDALASEPAAEACVAAARHVVSWSRAHRAEARILLRGAGDFAPGEWPQDTRWAVAAAQRGLEVALRRTASRLGADGADGVERVVFATVDVPYAAVRRHLSSRSGAIPARTEVLVEQAVRAILG